MDFLTLSRITRELRLSATQAMVLGAIHSYADNAGLCTAGVTAIARRAGVDRHSVDQIVDALTGQGKKRQGERPLVERSGGAVRLTAHFYQAAENCPAEIYHRQQTAEMRQAEICRRETGPSDQAADLCHQDQPDQGDSGDGLDGRDLAVGPHGRQDTERIPRQGAVKADDRTAVEQNHPSTLPSTDTQVSPESTSPGLETFQETREDTLTPVYNTYIYTKPITCVRARDEVPDRESCPAKWPWISGIWKQVYTDLPTTPGETWRGLAPPDGWSWADLIPPLERDEFDRKRVQALLAAIERNPEHALARHALVWRDWRRYAFWNDPDVDEDAFDPTHGCSVDEGLVKLAEVAAVDPERAAELATPTGQCPSPDDPDEDWRGRRLEILEAYGKLGRRPQKVQDLREFEGQYVMRGVPEPDPDDHLARKHYDATKARRLRLLYA